MQSEQAWWSEIEQARARIKALSAATGGLPTLEALLASESPAKDVLHDVSAADAIIDRIASPDAGSGDDLLCQWMFETYQSSDPDLQALVLRFVPAICNAYLPRASSKQGQPLAGFEAVLLALYSSEYKSRQGKPIPVTIPNLSQASLYHTPRASSPRPSVPRVGYLSPGLEPQEAVKTTKRATIVGVALDLYNRRIVSMPSRSKLEICEAVREWAIRGCSWAERVEEVAKLALLKSIAPGPDPTLTGNVSTVGPSSSTSIFVRRFTAHEDGYENGESSSERQNVRIHLPWELLQPLLKILGHCLMAPGIGRDVRDAAGCAVRALYARATHELIPEAIIPTRALLRLDEEARAAELAAAASAMVNTPTKPKKPEILLTPGK